jgi:hypothetical protein
MKRSHRNSRKSKDTIIASRANLYTAVVQRIADTTAATYINNFNATVANLLSDLSASNRLAKFKRIVVVFNPLAIPLNANIQSITAQLQEFDPRTGFYVPKTDLVPLSTTTRTQLFYVVDSAAQGYYTTTSSSSVFRLVLFNSQATSATTMQVPYTIYADVSLSRDLPAAVV